MSTHVCKCIHNGTEEFHLRMPGVSESRVEAIASLINSGKLDQADWQAATSLQEAKIKALVEALELLDAAYCENDMSTREARHRGRVALIKAREAIAAAKE